MRTLAFRILLSIFAGAAPLAVLVAGCGGDDSPSRPAGGSDAGVDDVEASVVDDAPGDAPGKDGSVQEGGGDALPDGVIDSDGDGVPDDEDVCPGFDDNIDTDGDGIPDGCDECPYGDNDLDSDGDGVADGCDICPGLDESIDTNGSGIPDCRDAMKLWLRADQDVFADDGSGAVGSLATDGDSVRRWKDQGVWSGHGDQTDPNRQPIFVEGVLPSGGSAVRFQGAVGPAGESPSNVDSLEGPFLISGRAGRTLFLVARTSQASDSSILELNRTGSASGSLYRLTPEIGVRVNNGSALFANHPLDDQFHIITVQNPTNGSTSDIRAWYDGIPIDASSVVARAVDTGSGGYRLGDGHVLGGAGFVGEIAEALVYERFLTPAQCSGVGLTLERKHGLKTWYVDNEEPVAVYLMAGQSNMVGQGVAVELTGPLSVVQGDVMAWTSNKAGWSPLVWGKGNGPDQFGPELAFGRTMADDKPDARVAIIKYAVNGTSLAQDWDPSSGLAFAGFEATVGNARQRLDSLGIAYEIRGLLWMQGESDAMEEAMADSYLENMTGFITAVRDLTEVSNLSVAIARIRGTMPAPFYHALAVRLAQETAAAMDPNVRVVDTDTLTLHPDGIHYDTAGQVKLGEVFANAMLLMAPP
jgi:hypothetical protein